MKQLDSFTLQFLIIILVLLPGCKSSSDLSGDYPINPVPFTQVKLTDNFWAPKIKRNHEVTIPIAFHQSEITGRIKNFEVAGGLQEGGFCSLYAYDDSDVYKIIEGASYSLQTIPDPKLEAYLDSLIFKIGEAQEDDGYLYTNRTIMGDSALDMAGPERWSHVERSSHELYNVGHMYEAAVAYFEATGKRSLLDIAIENADLVNNVFGWEGLVMAPGHQEIEIGLIKLYRTTGDKKYLDLAKFFLEARGPDGHKQLQMHAKVLDQTQAVGHAVRAGYMYSAMADIAAITGDSVYIEVIDQLWEDIAFKKTYVTGGIGTWAGNEGFDKPYLLPNDKAYCETCASVAYTFLNHRLFSLKGESKYYDMLEKTLYNALIAGVSLSGDHFFYPNPLQSDGSDERSEWFGCACCPSNITRFIPNIPGYIYSNTDDEIYINLFVGSEANIQLNGKPVEIKQHTEYPWKGQVKIDINPEKPGRFTLKIRQPGWAVNQAIPGDLYHYYTESQSAPELILNGEAIDAEIEKGYYVIDRRWKKGDQLTYNLPMEIRKLRPDEKIITDPNAIAIQRGPIIFCTEWADNPDEKILEIKLSKQSKPTSTYQKDLLGGTQIINLENHTLIPYYLWSNRGKGQMQVWHPLK